LVLPGFSVAQCVSGNCKNGKGTYKFKSGAKFIGTFSGGAMSNGMYYYANNDVYKGDFVDNKRDGEGHYIDSDGTIFKGTYEKGKRVEGYLEYVDGSIYSGQFKGVKKHGKGTLRTATGKVYAGYWENDEFLGEAPNNPIVTYALIVAIEDYKNAGWNTGDLKFTVTDAQKFKTFIRSGAIGGHEHEVELLVDQNATKQNIIESMERLFLKADKNDRVVFYFSGHGDRKVFLPYDAGDSSNSLLFHKEVKRIYKKSKSQHKVLIADACFSGSMKNDKSIKNFKFMEQDQRTLEKSYKEVEVAIMLSCSENELSIESRELKQGVFSYYLIKGLNGEADVNLNKAVSIEELYYYVRNNTYTYVKENSHGQIQRPILYGKFDRDMTMSIIK